MVIEIDLLYGILPSAVVYGHFLDFPNGVGKWVSWSIEIMVLETTIGSSLESDDR